MKSSSVEKNNNKIADNNLRKVRLVHNSTEPLNAFSLVHFENTRVFRERNENKST